jgi:hypothetical protein
MNIVLFLEEKMKDNQSRSRSSQKKEFLLKKMYNGAEALYDFFETIKNSRDVNPAEVAEQLKKQYKLTPNQRKYLDGVADRTSKARAVVQYLEHRFGLDKDQTFQDPQGLHELLFKDHKKRVKAVSYNFAIGFTNSYWKEDKDTFGYANNLIQEHSCFISPAKKTISRLERKLATDCGNLAFHLPSDTRIAKIAAEIDKTRTKNDKIYQTIFGTGHSERPKELKQQTITHELRHIIDMIINKRSNFFVETPAHLDTGVNMEIGLERDFNRKVKAIERKIEIREGMLEEFESMKAVPQTILDNAKRLLKEGQEEYNNFLEKSKKEAPRQLEIFRRFKGTRFTKGIFSGWEEERRVKSYLFTTIPPEKLFKRIQEITFAQPAEIELDEVKEDEEQLNKEPINGQRGNKIKLMQDLFGSL